MTRLIFAGLALAALSMPPIAAAQTSVPTEFRDWTQQPFSSDHYINQPLHRPAGGTVALQDPPPNSLWARHLAADININTGAWSFAVLDSAPRANNIWFFNYGRDAKGNLRASCPGTACFMRDSGIRMPLFSHDTRNGDNAAYASVWTFDYKAGQWKYGPGGHLSYAQQHPSNSLNNPIVHDLTGRQIGSFFACQRDGEKLYYDDTSATPSYDNNYSSWKNLQKMSCQNANISNVCKSRFETGDFVAGLIRKYDMDRLRTGKFIEHKLAIAVPNTGFDTYTLGTSSVHKKVYPVGEFDYAAAAGTDAVAALGQVAEGVTIAVPSDGSAPAPATAAEAAILYTLQNYGAVVVGGAGAPGLVFYGEQGIDDSASSPYALPTDVLAWKENQITFGDLRAALKKYVRYAKIVASPTQAVRSAGGVPLTNYTSQLAEIKRDPYYRPIAPLPAGGWDRWPNMTVFDPPFVRYGWQRILANKAYADPATRGQYWTALDCDPVTGLATPVTAAAASTR